MSIQDELNNELKDAMRAHDRNRTDVVRQIKTEIARTLKAPRVTGAADDELDRPTISPQAPTLGQAPRRFATFVDAGTRAAAWGGGGERVGRGRWLVRRARCYVLQPVSAPDDCARRP